jgi:hypothetical protein
MLGSSVQIRTTWSLEPRDAVGSSRSTEMIRGSAGSADDTVSPCLRERGVPGTWIRCWKTTDIVGWDGSIERYGLTGDTRLVRSKLGGIDHVSDTLSYLYATSSISKVEIATPVVVYKQELNFKVACFVDG